MILTAQRNEALNGQWVVERCWQKVQKHRDQLILENLIDSENFPQWAVSCLQNTKNRVCIDEKL